MVAWLGPGRRDLAGGQAAVTPRRAMGGSILPLARAPAVQGCEGWTFELAWVMMFA